MYTFKILGHKWTATVLKYKDYIKTHGNDSIAICDVKKREIHFCYGFCGIVQARHELFHAYISEHFPVEMQLDLEKFEEMCCEIVGRYGHTICNQSNSVYKKLLLKS